MPTRIEVKSQNTVLKAKRRSIAENVIAHFVKHLPDRRLLCFFDEEDWWFFKAKGEENRGGYVPYKRNDPEWRNYPFDVQKLILVPDPLTQVLEPKFDGFIYLHGSTCADETGMVMTFAHELQHFIQHGHSPKLWAANILIPHLPSPVVNALQLKWHDIPTEREARVIAKRTTESLCGPDAVKQYIARMLAKAVKPLDVADWRFIESLDAATDATDLAEATRLAFQKLKPYKTQLEEVLQHYKEEPEFKDIDLAELTQRSS